MYGPCFRLLYTYLFEQLLLKAAEGKPGEIPARSRHREQILNEDLKSGPLLNLVPIEMFRVKTSKANHGF